MFNLIKKTSPLALTLVIACYAYFLVYQKHITGNELVTLTMFAVFCGFVLYFAPKIQEISIKGSVLKLKESVQEAKKAEVSLKEFQVTTFSAILKTFHHELQDESIAKFIDIPDSRHEPFWELYKNLNALRLVDVLDKEIKESATKIAMSELSHLRNEDPLYSGFIIELISPKKLRKEKAELLDTEIGQAYTKLYNFINDIKE